jgi:hypothetical protein
MILKSDAVFVVSPNIPRCSLLLYITVKYLFESISICSDRNILPDASHHGDRAAGEDRVRRVLRRRDNLPGDVVHVPHSQLSLSVHRQALLEAGLLRHRHADNGFVRPLGLLRLLLPLPAEGGVPVGGVRVGHHQHHGQPVGQVLRVRVAAVQGGRLHDLRPERHRPGHPLRHSRGLVQQGQPEVARLADPDGAVVHHGGDAVRAEGARAVVPRQVRHLAALAPDLPRLRPGGRLRALSRYIRDGHVQGHDRAVRDARHTHLLTKELRMHDTVSIFVQFNKSIANQMICALCYGSLLIVACKIQHKSEDCANKTRHYLLLTFRCKCK